MNILYYAACFVVGYGAAAALGKVIGPRAIGWFTTGCTLLWFVVFGEWQMLALGLASGVASVRLY